MRNETRERLERDEMFTVGEVESILRRALTRKRDSGEITREELEETARELGIDSREVERAIHEQRRFGAIESAREAFRKRLKEGFYRHLRSYLIVNGALLLLDLVTTGGEWFYFPLIGWGIGLAFHASHAFNPSARAVESGARRVLRRRERNMMWSHDWQGE